MSETKILQAVLAGCAALILVCIYFTIAEGKQWDIYRASHHCHITGHISSSNGIGVGYKGDVVSTYIPGKTLWQCDGGEIVGR